MSEKDGSRREVQRTLCHKAANQNHVALRHNHKAGFPAIMGLTHVVLADYFAEHQIPRWADEGIAVLSEPTERRTKLREWLHQEATQGRLFSLNELTKQRSVPQDKRLGELFYAQSAALVEFLLAERKLSESEVLRFVAESEARGLPETIRRQFPETVADRWESDWRDWLVTPRVEVKVAETDRSNADRPANVLAD